MTAREVSAVTGWLIRDTFWQALANRLGWLLLGVIVVATALCCSVSIENAPLLEAAESHVEFLPAHDPEANQAHSEGLPLLQGSLNLGFGVWQIPIGRDASDAVKFLQIMLAGVVADTLGVMLALIWTAGFLPAFLDPRSCIVLLAKPISRRTLLIGKCLGVLTLTLAYALCFTLGTWLALGWRTGVWDAGYWLLVPIFLLHFSIFFGFSLFLAVAFRSSALCMIGSVLFWALCWGMNYGRHFVVAQRFAKTNASLSNTALNLVDLGYWILPKPTDLGMLLSDALDAAQVVGRLPQLVAVQQHGQFSPVWSVAASVAFLGLLVTCAVREFDAADY